MRSRWKLVLAWVVIAHAVEALVVYRGLTTERGVDGGWLAGTAIGSIVCTVLILTLLFAGGGDTPARSKPPKPTTAPPEPASPPDSAPPGSAPLSGVPPPPPAKPSGAIWPPAEPPGAEEPTAQPSSAAAWPSPVSSFETAAPPPSPPAVPAKRDRRADRRDEGGAWVKPLLWLLAIPGFALLGCAAMQPFVTGIGATEVYRATVMRPEDATVRHVRTERQYSRNGSKTVYLAEVELRGGERTEIDFHQRQVREGQPVRILVDPTGRARPDIELDRTNAIVFGGVGTLLEVGAWAVVLSRLRSS